VVEAVKRSTNNRDLIKLSIEVTSYRLVILAVVKDAMRLTNFTYSDVLRREMKPELVSTMDGQPPVPSDKSLYKSALYLHTKKETLI
jgi:hypothetical protein